MVENILSVRRNFKRRLFLAWAGLIFFIVYLIAVGVGYIVFYTGFFKIEKFEFAGFQKIDAVYLKHFLILEQLKNSSWRGFLSSDNFLFWLNFEPETVKLSAYLASLKLSSDFFERRVFIEIKERQPFGIWCHNKQMVNGKWQIDAEQCFWFDESGALFAPAPSAEGLLIPLIFDDNSRPEELSREMFSVFRRLYPVRNSLPQRFFGRASAGEISNGVYNLENIKIVKFFVKDENLKELEAEIINGPKLYLSLKGENEDLEAILEKLSQEVKFQNLEYIDLRVSGRVYYK